jgi:hypothetical protein
LASLDAALQLAGLIGNVAILEILLNLGADHSSRSSEFETPLMYAARSGHTSAVKFLLEKGANPLALNQANQTAANLAEEAGHEETARILLEPPSPEKRAEEPSTAAAPPLHAVLLPAKEDVALPDAFRITHFQESVLPYLLTEVAENSTYALVESLLGSQEVYQVSVGVIIPETDFQIVAIKHQLRASKGGKGHLVDVSTLTLEHRKTQQRVLVQRGLPMRTLESRVGLIFLGDGRNFTTQPGHHFTYGKAQYRVVDVRPTQVLVEDTHSLETLTIGRKGP